MVYAKITPKTMQKEMQKLNGMFNSMVQSDAIPPSDMNSLLAQMHGIMEKMQGVVKHPESLREQEAQGKTN